MQKILLTLIMVAFAIVADGNPLWMRYNTISPDGEKIAFVYKGDIFVVNTNGGVASQLTIGASHETNPIWSNDSQRIAYKSDHNGGFDIYTIPAKGGSPKRITTNSASETPLSFSPDDKEIYFTAAIQDPANSAMFPSGWITELYKVGINGGRASQVLAAPISSISFDKDGKSFLYYNRTGSENIWRKHHTSSVARDIFYYNSENGSHTKIIENKGEDRDPIYTPDGKEIIYLSERNGGSFNIYKASLTDPNNPLALTDFKKHPIRFLSQSKEGEICFGYHGEIYIMDKNNAPKKVNIEILNNRIKEDPISLSLGLADEFSLSKDGKEIALISRGEVFATTDKYSTTKQITKTPEAERGVTISPDGKIIVYASSRTGVWNIYKATKGRKEELNLANATIIKEEPLFTDNTIERFAPTFSPDGKEIAFIENRNILKVLNIKTNKVRTITDGSQHIQNDDYGFDYQWSPDGNWFAITLITNRRSPYSDIGIVSAKNGGKIYNITNSAYIDRSPKWALDGNAIIFTSNRLGLRSHASWGSQNDIFIAFLNQDSLNKFLLNKEELDILEETEKLAKEEKEKETEKKDKKKKKKDSDKDSDKDDKSEIKTIKIDFDRLDERVMRLTPMSSNIASAVLSKDGESLYFLSKFEKGYDLWEVKTRDRSIKLMKKLDGAYGFLALDESGKNLFLLGKSPVKISLPGGKSESINFQMKMELDRAKEREYMFNHVFTQQEKRFYNPNYHGVDLKILKKDYIPFLDHITNNYDFSEMLSEVLGELNVSHTGSGYRAKPASKSTPEFGLLFDTKYNGLRVEEVLDYGPFDNSKTKIVKGVIIEKIDNIEIGANTDYYPIINGKTKTTTLISLYNPQTKERWDEVFKPISKGMQNSLLYKRWIKSRAKEVERLSAGRLGYVHIESMGDESYRDVYSDILGKYNLKEGIVIDTRNNGGGRLHEDIEVLFSGEKYLEQIIRGVVTCEMPSRRYNKPSIMIVGEANYSNAHGTPWVYREKKMGSIVGMPVPGTMTSVNWESLQDASMYFGIPVVGYRTKDGQYLENLQLEPDFEVRNDYDKVTEGIDQQLEFAVKQLLKEIDEKPAQW